MDAGNLLKPLLARGELHMIGATTLDEYRKYIEKDAALERRFQPVMVDQPSVEDTISILRGLRERYEVHHGVRIKDSALVAAAVLSTATSPTGSCPIRRSIWSTKPPRNCAPKSIRCRPNSTRPRGASCNWRSSAKRCKQRERRRIAATARQARERTNRAARRKRRAQGALAARKGRGRIAARVCASRSKKTKLDVDRASQNADYATGLGLKYGRLASSNASSAQRNVAWLGRKALTQGRSRRERYRRIVSRWTGIPVSQIARGRGCEVTRARCRSCTNA